MKYISRQLLYFLALFFSLNALSGCADTNTEKTEAENPSIISQNNHSESMNNTKNDNEAETHIFLNITSGCIGCGKCLRFDPEHFEPDAQGRRVKAKTQNNLGSADLQTAIQICPVDAIILS